MAFANEAIVEVAMKGMALVDSEEHEVQADALYFSYWIHHGR